MFSWICCLLILGIVRMVSTAGENDLCVSFDSDPFSPSAKPQWTNTGEYFWNWTNAVNPPDISNIPSFYYDSGYVWFQDQLTPPQSATMQVAVLHTLDVGDVVTATIYRHVLEGSANDTSRPILRFLTNNVILNLIYTTNDELWDTVSETCGYSVQCCKDSIYPCSGYFQLNGEVMIRDELLAIDQIEVNAACGYHPSPYCCNFDNDLCEWQMPSDWMWSHNMNAPPFAPPPMHTNYVWVTLSEPQTSATLPTPMLMGVGFNSSITFSYYYFSNRKDNSLVFLFDKIQVYTLSYSHLDWQTITIGCKYACDSGSIQVEIICENTIGDTVCAIDGFTVNDTCEVDT